MPRVIEKLRFLENFNAIFGLNSVDDSGHIAGAEPVVDIDDGNVGAATVEHGEKRCQAA